MAPRLTQTTITFHHHILAALAIAAGLAVTPSLPAGA